ncbi:MAG: UDP-N-acetylglucosamine 2-epimerase (non-hydrolyzing) [Kiritimatiellia bacterium]
MSALTVMTVVGTRPEIIKLSRVIPELDRHTRHVLVHTGQNYDYELNAIFFEEMGVRKPDRFLNAAGANAAETIANVIRLSDAAMEEIRPDALLIYGDTNSCLCVISAKRRKIPVFHMEAGNRCFDQRVPEELNRKIVDHLSDINMVLTEHARRYLLAEGIRPETIIKTGSSMLEVLEHHRDQIAASGVLARLGLKAGGFFVVSAHREENIDSPANFADLLDSLRAIRDTHGMPVIVSTHPRTRKKMEATGVGDLGDGIHFLKPLGFFDYIALQQQAACVISDSGTITEESSLLGFPAVTIRQAHERPEGMDEGTLIMCGLRGADVLAAIRVAMEQKRAGADFRIVGDYDTRNVSAKVLRIILSYTGYVNRTVWRRES